MSGQRGGGGERRDRREPAVAGLAAGARAAHVRPALRRSPRPPRGADRRRRRPAGSTRALRARAPSSPRLPPRGSRRPRPGRGRPPSGAAPPPARPPSRVRWRRRPRSPARAHRARRPTRGPGRPCAPARRGRRRSAASRSSSAVTAAHMRSAATTPPQNACVCVTARWLGTETSARAPARAPSVEPALAVTAPYGAGAPPSTASTRSRNSPEEETARKTSPGRHANAPRASRPLGTATSSGPFPDSSEASQSATAT